MAPVFFGAAVKHDLPLRRDSVTWTEFLKARFMTDPIYYQFDRARVSVTPRDVITKKKIILDGHVHGTLLWMDRIRHSTNAFKQLPWNRRRDEVDEDIRRLLRRADKTDFRSFWNHWMRTILHPHDVNEELLCASMVAFSRSNDQDAIFEMILEPYYGIELDKERKTIRGGRDITKDSPIRPSHRLLHAITEAFGAMYEISTGMQLIDLISRRYSVSIPHEVWSSLLSWTYLCASKTYRPVREVVNESGSDKQNVIIKKDVLHVWDTMIGAPYNIRPTFEDAVIFVKALLQSRYIGTANKYIRSTLMPFYQAAVDECTEATFDEMLLSDAADGVKNGKAEPSTMLAYGLSGRHHIQRRQAAEARKDYIFNRISALFNDIPKVASQSRGHRSGRATRRIIPALARDFPQFFLNGIRYRTSSGKVVLREPTDVVRIRWANVTDNDERGTSILRQALPEKLSNIHVGDSAVDSEGNPRMIVNPETGEREENPEFQWRQIDRLVISEYQRRPRRRDVDLGSLSSLDGGDRKEQRKWWKKLETRLML
jgi:hypothetical protein